MTLLALLVAAPALAERRVALIIAADDYRLLRPLENAVNDGRTIEAALEKLGFEVFSETNRDLRRTRRALDDFREDAAGADVALVFFSGHGVEIAGENRLLPVDADPASLDRLAETSLRLEEVRDVVAATARIGLIVLDACRNDPFGSANGGGRGAVALNPAVVSAIKPGLGRVGRADNILFSFSAAPGQTASDGAAGNSEFTTALARFLPTQGLEIRSVLTLVQQEVYDVSRGKQLPYVESGLPKLFFAAETGGEVPERDRLLLAMADITSDLRSEVELIAADADMPLAPLYAALITSGGPSMKSGERRSKLKEAADAFVQVRADLRKLGSSDPQVTALRQEAEVQLALGAFDTARERLTRAAAIDGASRDDLKKNLVERTLSEATTHYLAGGAARAELRYELAIGDFGRAAALYDEVSGFEIPREASDQHLLALESIGGMQKSLGNLKGALDAYRGLERVAVARADKEPGIRNFQRDIIVTRNLIADILTTTGDFGQAIQTIEAAREILLRVSAQDFRVEDTRDLSVSFNRSGDVRRLYGDVQGALVDYRYGQQYLEILAKSLPDERIVQEDLSVSHSKIGLALRMASDPAAALAEYKVSLAISEKLLAAHPDDPVIQRGLTVGLNAIGEINAELGNEDIAMQNYDRSIAITRALMQRDPAETQWRSDLGIALNKVGDVKARRGDREAALADYLQAKALDEHLANLDATNVEWQRSLSIDHNKVGDMQQALGAGDDALASFQASLSIVESLRRIDQFNATWRRDESYTRNRVGDLLMARSDLQGALNNYLVSLDLAESFVKDDAENVIWQRDLAFTHNRAGHVLVAQKNLDGALGHYRAALDISLALVARGPANTIWLRDVYVTRLLIGDILSSRQDAAEAAKVYAELVNDAKAEQAAAPDTVQPFLDEAVALYKLGLSAVEPMKNYSAARDILVRLQATDRLPAENVEWIRVLDEAMKVPAK